MTQILVTPPTQIHLSRVSEQSNSLVVHFLTLRRALGLIGIALPFALVAGENLRDVLAPTASRGGRQLIEVSMSAYFHTGMRDVFVGSLCAIGVFLLCYKGYDRVEDTLANLAGVCAILVALFPTVETSREATDTGAPAIDSATFFSGPNAPDPAIVGYVHFAAAAVFFVVLAYLSYFRFTRTDPAAAPTPRKIQRNRIYRVCGVIIVLCIAGIALGSLVLDADQERATSFLFWFEAIAVMAFGVSWLTKGEMIRPDRA
jgi:hypothetical protein